MMAAFVIENGRRLKVEVHNSPSSIHNASLHDPIHESNPASPTTAGYMDGDPSDDLEEARTSSHKLQRSLSSAGKQLAEPSTLGPKADNLSEFPSELSVSNSSISSDDSIPVFTGEEAKIALSQLEELEVAIKERKGTKIDGRKTRWEDYRKEKGGKGSNSNSGSVDNLNCSSESELTEGLEDQKDVVKEAKKENNTKINYKVNELKAFVRSKFIQADHIKSEEVTEPLDNTANNNSAIADNFNYSDRSLDTMKVEDAGPVLGPIVTNNVLETMKQQFLEGTCNISESTPLPSKEKKTRKKRSPKLGCTNDENIKKKPGRPKKKERSLLSSMPKQEVTTLDLERALLCNDQESGSFAPTDKETLTPKKENHIGLSLSPDFYLRKNPVTRGLREVRKSESGSESNSSTPAKDTSLHLQLSPASPTLALSSNTITPLKYENTNGATKFPPLICTAAAKALLAYEQESNDRNKKKNIVKKLSQDENVMLASKICPQTENGESQDEDCPLSKLCTKRVNKRGRGKKKGATRGSWPKKTSMIVADVHNSMNGEPQAVIKTPAVGRKKKSLPPKMKTKTAESVAAIGSLNNSREELKSNKENSIKAVIPSLQCSASSLQSNVVPALSAYDNATKKIVSKSTNSIVKTNHLNLVHKDSSHENGIVNSIEKIPKEEIDFDYENKKSIYLHSNFVECGPQYFKSSKTECNIVQNMPEKKLKSSIDSATNSLCLSDKKKKVTSDCNASSISKGSVGISILLKPTTLSPHKSKSDSTQSTSNVSNTDCRTALPNGNQTIAESYSSVNDISLPGSLASPRKPLSAFSPDKQKREKYVKNKSINDIIEKLHKPLPALADSEEKSNTPVDDIKIEIKDEKLNSANSKTITEGLIELSENPAKVKKPPRFLRELFKDEGVQLMLGSIKTDVAEVGSVIDSGQHKLRPKRINDNSSESPEPEDSYQKRKKRNTEMDNLFVDEGALNLLTSIESNTRRTSLIDDNPYDNSNTNNKIAKNAILKLAEGKKRKLSGASNCSAGLIKSAMLGNKRMKLSFGNSKIALSSDAVKKKVGRPSNADLLKKKQLQENQSGVQQNQPKIPIPKPPSEVKSVPPIKIRLTSNEDGSTRPSISPSEQGKHPTSCINPANGKPAKSTPSLNKVEQKTVSHNSEGPRPVPSGSQPRVHGVLLKKLLPVGAPKTMKLGLIKPVDKDRQWQKLPSKVEVIRQSQRSSVRNEVNNHFRDIHLRKFNHFMHIIFNPSTTKMKNSFNSKVLRELCEALNYIKKDATVNLVLFTATGSTFCQGVDLTSLQHSNIEIRKKNAANLIRGIKEFLHCLITFPKMIVAGLNGSATGLGVTMLPLFDLVIASDKVEFSLPYGELGQVPEGGATYTFPQNYGKLQSNNMFMGKKFSASQAQSIGLVSETLWHGTFIQELIPRVAAIATHPGSGLEVTKALMNHHLMTKLELSVETECRALMQQWSSQSFAVQCKRYLESTYVLYQSPAFRQNQ